jgi:translation initiation factor 2 subunit 1
MFHKRTGYPEIDEIVLCKVTNLFPNAVFVELLEYGRQGLVHISEVSPGRIRNLRDFVTVGRQIVCKVLRIDQEKGHIDLSLRRVNSHQRQEKLDEIKSELKAESLVQNLAKKLKKPVPALYKEITEKVFKEYSHLYLCFRDVVAGDADLGKIGLEKALATELAQAILDKFKPNKITLQAEIILETYSPEGVEKIKATLQKIESLNDSLELFYLGAGRFNVIVTAEDYKPAEKVLSEVQALLEKFNDKLSKATFERNKE